MWTNPYSASVSLNWHSCFPLQILIFLNFFNYYCCCCFLLIFFFFEYSNIFQWRQFSIHIMLFPTGRLFSIFCGISFELFVRKDDGVCNKLDKMFIKTDMWYFVFIRVLIFRVNIRTRNIAKCLWQFKLTLAEGGYKFSQKFKVILQKLFCCIACSLSFAWFFNENDVTFLVHVINFFCLDDPNVIGSVRKL